MSGLQIDLRVYDSEDELVAGLHRGDPDACACLMKQYAARLFRRVLTIVGGDSDHAEAVVQSTFIKACDRFNSFEGRSQPGTWLYRIAINEALMQQRKAHAERQHVPLDLTDLLPTAAPIQHAKPCDPEGAALQNELAARLHAAIAALPAHYRQVFALRDMQGKSVKETAAALGVSESVVKVRLHRARKQLAAALRAYVTPTSDDA